MLYTNTHMDTVAFSELEENVRTLAKACRKKQYVRTGLTVADIEFEIDVEGAEVVSMAVSPFTGGYTVVFRK